MVFIAQFPPSVSLLFFAGEGHIPRELSGSDPLRTLPTGMGRESWRQAQVAGMGKALGVSGKSGPGLSPPGY